MIDESLDSDFEMDPTDLDSGSVTIGPFTASWVSDERVAVELQLGYTDSHIVMFLTHEEAERLSWLLAKPRGLPILC